MALTLCRQPIGHSRHRDNFLEFLYKASGIDEAELNALVLTFAEQSREGACFNPARHCEVLTMLLGPVMESESHIENIGRRVLAGGRGAV